MLAIHPFWNWSLVIVAGALLPTLIGMFCLGLAEGANSLMLACRLDCLVRYRVYRGLLFGGYGLLLATAFFCRHCFWPMDIGQLIVFLVLTALVILVILSLGLFISSSGSSITSPSRFSDEDDVWLEARELV